MVMLDETRAAKKQQKEAKEEERRTRSRETSERASVRTGRLPGWILRNNRSPVLSPAHERNRELVPEDGGVS